MIIIKGCTSDVIDDISEFIGSLSIDDVRLIDMSDLPLYEIIMSEKTVYFIIQAKSFFRNQLKNPADMQLLILDFRR